MRMRLSLCLLGRLCWRCNCLLFAIVFSLPAGDKSVFAGFGELPFGARGLTFDLAGTLFVTGWVSSLSAVGSGAARRGAVRGRGMVRPHAGVSLAADLWTEQ